jgi:hypothetical protein
MGGSGSGLIYGIILGRTEGNHKNPVSGPRFEHETPRIRSSSADHFLATFGPVSSYL